MSDPTTRQDAEHRLANLVSRWVAARDDKAADMKTHNDGIKGLEEAIETLSAQIEGGGFQDSLPFGGNVEAAWVAMRKAAQRD